ncbi:MAG TPA: hypothetical protein VGD55_14695, partial [Acidothermaceae bacterium]
MGSALKSRRWLSGRAATGACLLAVVAVTLAACASPKPIKFVAEGSVPAAPVSSPPPTQKQSTLALLALLQDRTGPPAPGYTVDQFGSTLRAVSGSGGCNSRDFILKRDLIGLTYQTGSTCIVNSGVLFDRYTGQWFWYSKREAVHLVATDDVVSLADAWANGASTWSATQRSEFVNDPEELIETSTAAVAAKAGRSADLWLPTDVGMRCVYVADQITVKSAYLLTVTP